MYSLKSVVVTAHIEGLLAEAAAHRLAKGARRENRSITSSLRSVWSVLTGPVERPVGLPKLTNYPYES